MSAAAPPAARLHDPVAHSRALGGFLAGALVGIAAAAAVAVVVGMAATAIAAEVATAGLATPLVAGVAVTVGEFAINAVVGGKLMGLAEEAGESLGSHSMGAPSGEIAQGSPDVAVNDLPAGRVTDAESCHAGKIAEGSATVFINDLPAARVADKTTCGAAILQGSPDVFIAGPTVTRLPVQSEVPAWARWAAVVAGIVPALGGLARAIGPALAEIEATGFARAAQTGVKALGRAMEERAGGARPAAGEAAASEEAAAGRAARPSEPQRALPAPKPREALPPPTPSRYPFEAEPPMPAGGGRKIDFSAKRPGLDMDDLSATDQAADRAMAQGGWDAAAREQVLNSGDEFSIVQGKANDPMYKFSSAGRNEATAPSSAYYTDKAGFEELESRHFDSATGKWDSAGVKNELALPCYNSADAVWRGSLMRDQPLVHSTINPAVETVTMTNPDGSIGSVFQRAMSGGGGQIAPESGGIGNLKPFVPGGRP